MRRSRQGLGDLGGVEEIDVEQEHEQERAEVPEPIGEHDEDEQERRVGREEDRVIWECSVRDRVERPIVEHPIERKRGEDRAAEEVLVGEVHDARQELAASSEEETEHRRGLEAGRGEGVAEGDGGEGGAADSQPDQAERCGLGEGFTVGGRELDLVDHRDPEVDLIGAANTIIREADGTLTAANTDAPAVLATLRDDANFAAAGRSVLILGASGAARAAAYALIQANISSLTVINRTLLRAEELLADLIESTQTQIPIFAYSNDDSELAEAIAGIDLIINATSIGWQNDQTPLDKQYIRPHMLVFDMVYRSTRLLHEATAQGAQTLNGKGMLVRQAGLAFQRWTNQPAPINVMMHAFDQENR